jgi:hypothetical protein
VNLSTSPRVGYTYSDGTAGHVRRTRMPSPRESPLTSRSGSLQSGAGASRLEDRWTVSWYENNSNRCFPIKTEFRGF